MMMQKPLQQVSKTYKAQTRFLFYCHIKIKIPAFYNDAYFDVLFAELEYIDKLYNSYTSGSYIDLINQNSGSFVEVDQFTVKLLQQVKKLSTYFNGAYDVTAMPLLQLWGMYKEDLTKVPSIKQIEQAQQLVDYHKIEIKENRVKIDKGQQISTASFLKAHAIDLLLIKLKKDGVTDAMINAGGSTIACLADEQHPFWKVDVPDLEHSPKKLFQLKLSNACFSTSARNGHKILHGRKYGHIINANTGFPSNNHQIGLLTENCFLGDVLATGLFAIPSHRFLETLEEIKQDYNISGFLMNEEGKMISSENFPTNLEKL